MSKDDYSKQLARRQKIKDKTLVAGLDIGYEFNAMALMNREGKVLGKYPRIYNSRKGFDYFEQIIENGKRLYGLNDVLIGMEPTGHYWRKIAYFAKDKGYEVKFIKTTALKSQRELNESSLAKSDVRDALTITNTIREGKYIDTVIENGIFRQLRTMVRVRERLQKHLTSSKHALRAALDDYFPELLCMFSRIEAKSLQTLLDICPFPEDVLRLKEAEIAEIIAKTSRRRNVAQQKASNIYQAAKTSIGIKSVGKADRYRLSMYLDELRHFIKRLKEIEKQIIILVKKIPCAEYMLSIRGIGPITAGIFLGELGNPYNFKSPKQMVKYAGYDPIERDSGKRTGRRFISKNGRWLLRKCLYFMSINAVRHNDYFKRYYNKKLENKNIFGRTLKKKEALCAVIIKLNKVIFALLRDKRVFTPEAPVLNNRVVAKGEPYPLVGLREACLN